ncbi:hypothetical protein [Hoyosella subflava]|nr:hypothetical protein [Hoyosella subflava]
MRGVVGHSRNERDRGCATTDHDDLLADVIEVFRPVLVIEAP